MSAQIILKMSAEEFDALRKAVELAKTRSGELWRDAKGRELPQGQYADHYEFESRCERLLKHTLT